MATDIHPVEISDGIAGLDIRLDGDSSVALDIWQLGEMKDVILPRELPCMMPAPLFVTDLLLEDDSQGGGGASQQTVTYALNYRVFIAAIGEKQGIRKAYKALANWWAAIFTALDTYDHDSYAVDMRPVLLGGFGSPLEGPDGTPFFGFDIGIQIKEFVN